MSSMTVNERDTRPSVAPVRSACKRNQRMEVRLTDGRAFARGDAVVTLKALRFGDIVFATAADFFFAVGVGGTSHAMFAFAAALISAPRTSRSMSASLLM